MVAGEPHLLMKVLARIEDEGLGGPEMARQIAAQGLARTVRAVPPDGLEPVGSAPRGSHKREVGEWVALLHESATRLANGQCYNRDQAVIDEPLAQVVDRYVRRRRT